ncbi:MAG: ATP-binding protein [Endomicrobiales bacterium]|nr:ATP-binding protein [Endomicrobiales bacterium]
MIISIASGKGGTGKTTVAVNLALSVVNTQLLDCDVEEPNAHLFLKPEIANSVPAYTPVPVIDEQKCNWCGVCREACAYNALAVIPPDGPQKKGAVLVFPHLCHGCGACAFLCPRKAINEERKEIGVVESGRCGDLLFVHGKLKIGEVMAPPLVRQVKRHADSGRTVIIDAPPGTSCPVIAAVKGSDYCVLVTEPTPFGLNDLGLAVEVLKKLGIPFGVVINRSDIGDDKTEAFCRNEGVSVLMRIPFDKDIAVLYSKGIPFVREKKEYIKGFRAMFDGIKRTLR